MKTAPSLDVRCYAGRAPKTITGLQRTLTRIRRRELSKDYEENRYLKNAIAALIDNGHLEQ